MCNSIPQIIQIDLTNSVQLNSVTLQLDSEGLFQDPTKYVYAFVVSLSEKKQEMKWILFRIYLQTKKAFEFLFPRYIQSRLIFLKNLKNVTSENFIYRFLY